jgi:hypothetical protein
MFTDEDLFSITITTDRQQLSNSAHKQTQTLGLATKDQETDTRNSIHSVEVPAAHQIQADPKEISNIQQLDSEQFDQDQLAGFLRGRMRLLNSALREFSMLQGSKRRPR